MAVEARSLPIHQAGLGGQEVRSDSAAESPQPVSALVERGRIVNVNIRDYTVDARSEHTFKPKFDIPFMVPYCDSTNGEGMNFMPEVGSTCWICTPSEEKRESFILGWTMPDEQGAYRAGRVLLNPGDMHFSTRDGNFVSIKRGGIVQIASTALCQRMYFPIGNVIKDFCESYELHTLAGDLTWSVARTEEDADGHRKTTFILQAHEFADDPSGKALVTLKIGSLEGQDGTILNLETLDRGNGATQTALAITKSGQVTWTVKKFSFIATQGDVLLQAKAGKLAVKSSGDMSLISGSKIDVGDASTPVTNVTAGNTKMALSSSGIDMSSAPAVNFPDGQAPPVRASADFNTWMAAVTAAINNPGAGNPVLGVPLVAPTQHVNGKVKV